MTYISTSWLCCMSIVQEGRSHMALVSPVPELTRHALRDSIPLQGPAAPIGTRHCCILSSGDGMFIWVDRSKAAELRQPHACIAMTRPFPVMCFHLPPKRPSAFMWVCRHRDAGGPVRGDPTGGDLRRGTKTALVLHTVLLVLFMCHTLILLVEFLSYKSSKLSISFMPPCQGRLTKQARAILTLHPPFEILNLARPTRSTATRRRRPSRPSSGYDATRARYCYSTRFHSPTHLSHSLFLGPFSRFPSPHLA